MYSWRPRAIRGRRAASRGPGTTDRRTAGTRGRTPSYRASRETPPLRASHRPCTTRDGKSEAIPRSPRTARAASTWRGSRSDRRRQNSRVGSSSLGTRTSGQRTISHPLFSPATTPRATNSAVQGTHVLPTKSGSRSTTRAAPVTGTCTFRGPSSRAATARRLCSSGPVTWADYRTGDADVLLGRSTDRGVSWSPPSRVNDVTTNHQIFPAITTFRGRVDVSFYDSRNDPEGKLLDIYYAQSNDDGLTFPPNVRVTDAAFDPNLGVTGGGAAFLGDYNGIASNAAGAHPIWADNRNVSPSALRDQDIYTATIS